MQPQRWPNDFGSLPWQIIQHHSNPSLCPNHYCQRNWSLLVLWRPTRSSSTITKKRCPFHHRGLEYKSRKSRDTQNRVTGKFGLGSTKWSRAKANGALSREYAGHRKHPFPTTQETTLQMDITKWSIRKSDCLCSLQPKIEKLYSQQKQHMELTVAQIISSLLKNSGLNWRK